MRNKYLLIFMEKANSNIRVESKWIKIVFQGICTSGTYDNRTSINSFNYSSLFLDGFFSFVLLREMMMIFNYMNIN